MIKKKKNKYNRMKTMKFKRLKLNLINNIKIWSTSTINHKNIITIITLNEFYIKYYEEYKPKDIKQLLPFYSDALAYQNCFKNGEQQI